MNNEKPKVVGGIGEKKSNSGRQWYQQDRIYDDNVAISVTTAFNPYYKNKLRIRKLTPKECWRLMGFDDEDFNKASQVCSNTQLYKQAGNSIVVNVLEAILNNLVA
jgi:DNA (cytosine-5)-methyltransferase 1